MQRNKFLVLFIQIAPVHSKFDNKKLTEDDAVPPESPPFTAPPFYLVMSFCSVRMIATVFQKSTYHYKT